MAFGRSEPAWTEPGAWEVADGVYRIPLPLPTDGLRAVNVYAIEHEDGLTLIDGGWAVGDAGTVLDRALRSIGRRPAEIRRVLVTHIHRDHYTQAIVLRRDHGSTVSLGAGEQEALKILNKPWTPRVQVAMLEESGAPKLAAWWQDTFEALERDLSLWESPDEWLTGERPVRLGDRVLDVYETPGHTQGHLVFADPAAGLMFAGDHVLPTITPSIGYEPVRSASPLADYLASLAKVRALPDLVLLPAHGPSGGSLHHRVDELLAHHHDRLGRCLVIASGGPVTAAEVAEALAWTRRERAFSSLDEYNAALAVLETRAHLVVLVAQGELVRVDAQGAGDVVTYRRRAG